MADEKTKQYAAAVSWDDPARVAKPKYHLPTRPPASAMNDTAVVEMSPQEILSKLRRARSELEAIRWRATKVAASDFTDASALETKEIIRLAQAVVDLFEPNPKVSRPRKWDKTKSKAIDYFEKYWRPYSENVPGVTSAVLQRTDFPLWTALVSHQRRAAKPFSDLLPLARKKRLAATPEEQVRLERERERQRVKARRYRQEKST